MDTQACATVRVELKDQFVYAGQRYRRHEILDVPPKVANYLFHYNKAVLFEDEAGE